MSDQERDQLKHWLIKASVTIGVTMLLQFSGLIWSAAKLDSKVSDLSAEVSIIRPRVDELWYRYGSQEGRK